MPRSEFSVVNSDGMFSTALRGNSVVVRCIREWRVARRDEREGAMSAKALLLFAKCRVYLHKALRELKLRLVLLAVGDSC